MTLAAQATWWEDHVERLEELATALIETGTRHGEEASLLYGQRLKAGVRALTSVSSHLPRPVPLSPNFARLRSYHHSLVCRA